MSDSGHKQGTTIMADPDAIAQNKLLRRLPKRELAGFRDHLELIEWRFKQPILEQGNRVHQVYFPLRGVASMVTDFENDDSVETGTVGREGIVGVPAFLGAKVSPSRVFCQIPGAALRMDAADLDAAVNAGGKLRDVLHGYTNAFIAMLSQNVACNRVHAVERRMARWLLMTRDRVDADDFPLTQEFLALMLGVRRPTVSGAGSTLQSAGLIKYSRGRITIVDRSGLEEASCECYARMKALFAGSDVDP
jgi:CRP-like cAMP-binding protein